MLSIVQSVHKVSRAIFTAPVYFRQLLCCHFPAGIGTFPTGPGAFLTVRIRVLFTLRSTVFANLRTEGTDFYYISLMLNTGSFRHKRGRRPADLCTKAIKMDAVGHRLHMRFLKAGCCAVIAGICTTVTGGHTGSVFFLYHHPRF